MHTGDNNTLVNDKLAINSSPPLSPCFAITLPLTDSGLAMGRALVDGTLTNVTQAGALKSGCLVGLAQSCSWSLVTTAWEQP